MPNHKQKSKEWLTPMEAARDAIEGIGKVKNVKQTLREFDELQYAKPKDYGSKEIVYLRKNKMKMSQSVFARVCNIKLATLQKWERGVRKPTPPMHRLFQLIEKDAISLITKL